MTPTRLPTTCSGAHFILLSRNPEAVRWPSSPFADEKLSPRKVKWITKGALPTLTSSFALSYSGLVKAVGPSSLQF